MHNPSKRYRRAIGIDETKIEVERRWWYSLWAAIDSDNREVLGIKNIGCNRAHVAPAAPSEALFMANATKLLVMDRNGVAVVMEVGGDITLRITFYLH